MARRAFLILAIVALPCGWARADEKYSFHEAVQVGQKMPEMMTCSSHYKTTANTEGKSQTTENNSTQRLDAKVTVLAVKDGSATEIRVVVDPASADTEQDDAQPVKKTPCCYAGQTITLRRRPDESVADDFSDPKKADPVDKDNLTGLLNPDQDFFPDHPVAVGDSWDISTALGKHSQLGPEDKLIAKCRLDWVKTFAGRKFAQFTCSCGIIRYEDDNVEEDIESSSLMLVDVARSAIVRADESGTSSYSTPKTEPHQVSGTSEFTFHGEEPGAVPTEIPATRP